jgi:hypothetical protein
MTASALPYFRSSALSPDSPLTPENAKCYPFGNAYPLESLLLSNGDKDRPDASGRGGNG